MRGLYLDLKQHNYFDLTKQYMGIKVLKYINKTILKMQTIKHTLQGRRKAARVTSDVYDGIKQ